MPPKKSSRTKKETATPAKAQMGNARIEKYYNKIVAVFIGLTALLLILIVYFSFSKTTVTVTAEEVSETVTAKTSVKELKGTVLLTTVEGSKEYESATTAVGTPGKATGTVTIVNNYNQSQSLVATTRLLSKEGVLFRTQETITVPAGDSVDVDVIADQEGASGNISASTFEIVALWPGLKEKIYGTSSAAMTGGIVYTTTVTAQDIEKAKTALSAELFAEAKKMFNQEIEKRTGLSADPWIPENGITIVETITNEVDAKEGDTVGSITATQKITVAAIVLGKNDVVNYTTTAIEKTLTEKKYEGMKLGRAIAIEDVDITLNELKEDRVDGSVGLSVDAPLVLNTNNALFDKKKLTGKTKSDIQSYFAGKDGVKSVDVRFSPFWVKKTPAFADNISIEIK